MRVGISLLTCNYLHWTKECLRTLVKYTNMRDVVICILDNGSTDGTPAYLSTLPYDIIPSRSNVGVAAGRNITFHKLLNDYELDFIMIIHNDMLFTPYWLEKFLSFFSALKPRTVIGCSNIIGDWSINLTDDDRELFAGQVVNQKFGNANFEPRLYPVSVFSDVGFFDEQFIQQECEDVDFNIRMSQAGYDVIGTNSIVIFHAYRLIRSNVPDSEKYISRNQLLLRKKWPSLDWNLYNKFSRNTVTYNGIPFVYHCVK